MHKKVVFFISCFLATSLLMVNAGAENVVASEWLETEIIMGDVNGDGVLNKEDIDIIVNSQIPQTINKTNIQLSSSQKKIADINKNGIIDAKDVEILTNIYSDELTPYEVKMAYNIDTNFKSKTISLGDGFIKPTAIGIDVSIWQGYIDWETVANTGIDFAIIRAGYGKEPSQEDIRFKENIENAKKYGIDVGVYWYSYATSVEEAIQEAEACYNTIKGVKLQYPVFFDIEEQRHCDLGKTTCSAIIDAFCEKIESYGYYPGVYSYACFLNDYVDSSIKDKYDIWVADFLLAETKNVSYFGDYQIWQYAAIGYNEGINGDLDLDYAYKNYPYIMDKYKLNDGIPN